MFKWFKFIISNINNRKSPQLLNCSDQKDCDELYARIPNKTKAPALNFLAKELAPDAALIRGAHMEDPEGWYIPYHFFWGMGIRNALRKAGFGEEYFSIQNLDDIYIQLVIEALELN